MQHHEVSQCCPRIGLTDKMINKNVYSSARVLKQFTASTTTLFPVFCPATEYGNVSIPWHAAPYSPFWLTTIIPPKNLGWYVAIRFSAFSPASWGVKPSRKYSTANRDGRNRIMTSPSPVAEAAPIVASAYAPEPAIGESPTRLQE